MQDPSLGMSTETLLARFSSSFQDSPNEQAQCMFLTYILTACLTAIVRGEDELDLPQMKAELVAEVVIMGDALGHYVAELGVLLMDPKRQVGRHAQEGIYRLYELALQQRGIDIREMAGLWIREPHLDWEMASYQNTVQMAKVS
ncbi:hypothetical protein JRQ81_010800 [Phrynocephalus forsythii]|uniref:Maestro-like HEAT-repeats domain-containing protein n=1 Tax=Phrynocephalus forsythii TaxID=171643 RepID=A0A9Q0XAF4_9SAUR|nr:hypothetical protein JRQ81_010800 [Phrynocephalus forsythii]